MGRRNYGYPSRFEPGILGHKLAPPSSSRHIVATELLGKTGDLSNKKFAIVVSTYHRNITGPLLDGALEELAVEGVQEDNITVVWVPGAWELPLAAQALIQNDCDYAALICLGCVIKGETTHDHHINTMVSTNLGQMSTDSGIPVAFGLLTCNTLQQAIDRSGGEVGNKGIEATNAAIRMVRLFEEIKSQK